MGWNVERTRHEIEQPRRPVGYKDNTSNPDPANGLTQDKTIPAYHYAIILGIISQQPRVPPEALA